MKATFTLDPCYTLVVGGDLPLGADQNLVSLQLLHTPLPTPITDGSFTPGTVKEPGQPVITGYNHAPTDVVFAITLKSSHARAIASGILAAATEARS